MSYHTMLFDVLSTRISIERISKAEPAKKPEVREITFHPTVRSLFKSLGKKHWGGRFHPVAFIYGMGITLFGSGFLLGVYVLYTRIIQDLPSLRAMKMSRCFS